MDCKRAYRARIFVVDGEVNARAAVTGLLRDAGYQVDGAADDEQALAQIAAVRPDLVLTDVTGPGLSEHQRLARLRGSAPGAAVVAMTAFGSVDAGIAAIERGADDFISKPVERRQLLQVTGRTLALRALERETSHLREALAGLAAPSPQAEDAPLALLALRSGPAIPGSSLQAIEQFAMRQTLEHVGGSTCEAAKILGISQRTLQQRIRAQRGEAAVPEGASR